MFVTKVLLVQPKSMERRFAGVIFYCMIQMKLKFVEENLFGNILKSHMGKFPLNIYYMIKLNMYVYCYDYSFIIEN